VPDPAADAYERPEPYRSNRSALKVATDQDYEMAVLRWLSGERGYCSLDPAEVQEALLHEAAEVNPDPSLFRQFPDAVLSLNRLAAERFLRGDRVYAPPSLVPSDALPSPPLPDAPEAGAPEQERAGDAGGSAFELAEQSESPRQCPYCGETLPGGAFRHLRDDADAIFLGALGDPRVPGNEHARDILLGLRFRLDLYINFRPVQLLHPDFAALRGDRRTIDFVIFRENTEGIYL